MKVTEINDLPITYLKNMDMDIFGVRGISYVRY